MVSGFVQKKMEGVMGEMGGMGPGGDQGGFNPFAHVLEKLGEEFPNRDVSIQDAVGFILNGLSKELDE